LKLPPGPAAVNRDEGKWNSVRRVPVLGSCAQPHWPLQAEPKVLEDPELPPDMGMPGIAKRRMEL